MRRLGQILLVWLLLVAPVQAQDSRWVAAWASAQMIADGSNAPPEPEGVTLRQIVRVTLGGQRVRVRISNVFGNGPLTVADTSVGIAVAPDGPALDPDSLRPLRFNGRAEVVIP